MHRIVKSHLSNFATEFGFENDEESVQFEKFANCCIFQSKIAKKIDALEVTTLNDDDGIDGIALIVNEDITQSKEDADLIFSKDRRSNDAEVVFIQAKRSEGFDLGEFLKFRHSIERFLNQTPYTSNSDLQKDVRAAFDTVLDNAPKLRGGKPAFSAYYVSTGVYNEPTAIETARLELQQYIHSLGFFSKIEIKFIGREELIQLWVDSYSGIEASLLMHSHAGLPAISGIDESYLAIVKAKDFVEQILTNDDGSIRGQIFEDNVRHYLGNENEVNASIAKTLTNPDSRTRFPVLNNGVTLVSPDVVVQSNRLFVKNFQIVNGCQTSHVLFENASSIQDDVMMTLKIIETGNEDVFGELVRATNSQSAIKDTQFLSLSPKARTVEAYFNTYEGQDGRLYLERRERQYAGKGVPNIRIIDLDEVARAVCSLYLKRPDLAFKYPAKMYEELGSKIFLESNKDSIYYSSALILYKIHLFTSGGSVPSIARKYKWHVLPIVGALIAGRNIPHLNSTKIDQYAAKIISKLMESNEKAAEVLTQAANLIATHGEISTDVLRRQATLDEILARV